MHEHVKINIHDSSLGMEDLKTSDSSGIRAWLHRNQCSEKKMQLLVQGKRTGPLRKSNKKSPAFSGLDCMLGKASVEESPLVNHENLLILGT